jgi:hypothetical protein
MMLDMLPPSGGNERLTLVVRRPDESLHDYLVRCQWELGDRVRFLASVRDAQWTILGTERQRWRRRSLLLTFTGPVIAALAYAGLGLCGAADSVPVPLMAGLIACAGLAGAALAIGIARIIDSIPNWLVTRRVRRWA